MSELSAYERQRLMTIKENQAKLVDLGLAEAADALRSATAAKAPRQVRKRPRESTAPAAPSRKSGRLSGEYVPDVGSESFDARDALEQAAEQLPTHGLKRASNTKRLSERQMAMLNALESVSSEALSAEEVAAVARAREDMASGRTVGG